MKEYIEEIRNFLNKIYLFDNPFNSATYISEKYIDKIGRIIYDCEKIAEKAGYRITREKIKHGIVSMSPLLYNKNVRRIDLTKIVQMHNSEILNFLKVVESVFPKELLSNLYTNLESLKVSTGKLEKYNNQLVGQYDMVKNSIIIDQNLINIELQITFYHEMFHMASTLILNKIRYGGFSYCENGYNLGVAINEGYTEIMTYRYFFQNKNGVSGYDKEIKYATIIENIVGKETMEKLYITANLKGLITELKKYASEDDIINFIMETDELLNNKTRHKMPYQQLNAYQKNEIREREKKEIKVNLFLASLKLKKERKEDVAIQLLKQNNADELYIISGEEVGKNIYMSCLNLYNNAYTEYDLKCLFDVIGYDKLYDVCFVSGISGLINELKKYSNQEDVDKYLKLLNTSLDRSLDKAAYSTQVYRYHSILYNYPLALSIIKNNMIDDTNIKATINAGFRINNDYSLDMNNSYFFTLYNDFLKLRNDLLTKIGNTYEEMESYNTYSNVIRIENLVGKSEMLKMFVLGDTCSIINEIRKHTSEEEFNRLINSSWIDVYHHNLKEFGKNRVV